MLTGTPFLAKLCEIFQTCLSQFLAINAGSVLTNKDKPERFKCFQDKI